MNKYNHIINSLFVLILLCGFFPLSAQNSEGGSPQLLENGKQAVVLRTVKGKIVDAATKEPLLGARVQSKDQLYSAMTNENGEFTIQIPEYLNLLVTSAPDYSSLDFPLRAREDVEIALFHDRGQLRNNSALTADDEMASLAEGYVRTIKRSGTPGIGSAMFIRGYNSLNAGAQPLVIVDGSIFDNQYDRTSIHDGFQTNPLANISVDDIESIRVIKDGTSLYGSKGGNGVVIIDTKRGKDPVTRITASLMAGYNEKPKTMPVLDAGQYRVYLSDILKDVYRDPSYLDALPFLNDNVEYYDYARYHNNNDWSKDVYRNSMTQSYHVGVSGGDDVALYNLSMGYADSKSTLKANDFSRFNARFNSDVELTSKLSFSFDLSYSQSDYNLRDDGFGESSTNLTSLSALSLVKAPFLIPYEYSNTGRVSSDISDSDFMNVSNPVAIIENGVGESSQDYLTISIRPSFRFTKELKLSAMFNYTMNSLYEKYFLPDEGVRSILLPDFSNSTNFVKAQNTKQNSISANLFLNWNKTFNNIHALDLTGGARYLSDTYKGEFGSGYNTGSDLNQNLTGSLKSRVADGYDDSWRSFSWYANAEYSLYEKYLLSLSASADASSRFGKEADLDLKAAGVNWALFPSVGAAWLVSSENFMANLPFINLLKVRLSYGLSGNDNIPTGSTVTYLSSLRYINEYTGKVISNIGNYTLKPETVAKSNAGIDLGFLGDRISLSADFFLHKTSDLLALKSFDYHAGMTHYWDNGGKLENKGYELSIHTKPVVLKNFSWELGGSVAHYKNKIVSLPDGDYVTSIYKGEILTQVGQPAGLFYGYKTDGVFATSREATEADLKVVNATGVGYTNFKAGDMRFVDLHQDGIINELDKTVIGDPNPDLTGIFNTRLSYKGLSVQALFSFSYGNDIYNYARSQMESGSLHNQSAAMQNRWVNEGQHTLVPRVVYGDPMGNSRFSDRWIEDGSYLRFKTLSVSYDVPLNWMFLSGFTIWASANNLWTSTKYLGGDPEQSVNNSVLYQGIDTGLLSQGRSYFIGLKLNL